MNSFSSDMLSEEEKAYRKRIDDCAFRAVNMPIANSLPEHAVYLMKKMFETASDCVRIYTGTLAKHGANGAEVYVSKKLIDEAMSFLRKPGTTLTIAVQKEIDGGEQNHPFIKAIKALESSGNLKGEVKVLTGATGGDVKNHMMLADKSAYRIELNHDQCKAEANFGDFSFAKKLVAYFDKTTLPTGNLIYSSN